MKRILLTLLCLMYATSALAAPVLSGGVVGGEYDSDQLPPDTLLLGTTSYTDQSTYSIDTNQMAFENSGFVAVQTGPANKIKFYSRNFTASAMKVVLTNSSGVFLDFATVSAGTGVKTGTLSGTVTINAGTTYKIGIIANGYWYPPSGDGCGKDTNGTYASPHDPMQQNAAQSLIDVPAWVTT